MKPLLVLNVVGLTPDLLPHAPRLSALARDGFTAPLEPVLPAVTCSVQSTLLTGLPPAEHGAPGRETCLALLYRGPNAIEQIRKTLGATNPDKAEGGTVRHMYGVNLMKNTAHASDSPASATRERKIVDLAKTERCCDVKETIDDYLASGGRSK